MANRKAIPKAISDKLLVDAMHRCCLCPEHQDLVDRHHIDPISEGGPDTEDNLMAVCPTCHGRIHRIRGMYSPEQLKMYKERWVQLCALGLPLDIRLAQALDITKPPQAPKMPPGIPPPPQPYFAHPYPLQPNFTGRVDERKMLTDWLVKGREPVFALTAIGGMGKSALTWAWLQREVLGFPLPGTTDEQPEITDACRVPEEARPEGVLWFSFYDREGAFSSFLDKALIYASGGSIDPMSIPSDYDKVQALLSLLQQRRLLLVLDGFERILRAYARLDAAYQGDKIEEDERGDFRSCLDRHAGDFLNCIASLHLESRVLLTSRLLPRELDDLAGCRHQELLKMAKEDAVAFFHAQGIRGTRADIEEACGPYGYHPLALRLLAGVILKDKRKPGDIQVASRHPVVPELKGKEGHHILQVAYDAMAKPKQTLLSRIAAFRSPMTYETLTVFNTRKSEEEFDAALDELIERGLLFFDSQQGRYDLHPIVRQHAYDRLADKEGVHARLRDYLASVPLPDEEEVDSLEDLAPVIELYHHTVRAARHDEACDLFYEHLNQPLYYRFGVYQTCIELLRELFPEGQDRPPRLKEESDQAWTLSALANSYSLSGQSRRALPLLETHNLLQENAGDKTNLAVGLGNLAQDQLSLGEMRASENNLRRRTEICHEVEDEFKEGIGHRDLCRLLACRGEFDEADGEFDIAHRLLGKPQPAQSQGVAWAYRAQSALLAGDAKVALNAAHQSLAFWKKCAQEEFPVERDLIRAEWLLGWSLVTLALDEQERQGERLGEAETHLTEALTRCRRVNMIDHEPDILLAWAWWHRAKGDTEKARADAGEALSIADRCEYRLCQADIHNFLARLDMEAGEKEKAIGHAQTGYERAWCDGPPHCYKPALDEAERLLEELKAPIPKI